MTSRDDDNTLREAFASLADDARPRVGCPPPERLWAAIEGDLPVDERHRLVDHIATCPSCAEDWRAAYRMGARPPAWWKPILRAVRKVLPSTPTWLPQASAALTGVAALVVAAVMVPRWIPGTETTSSTDLASNQWLLDDEVYRGENGIEAIGSATALLPRDQCWLKWSKVEGALYDLTVRTRSDELITRVHGLEKPEYHVLSEDLHDVAPGEPLVWFVDAVLPSGRRISSPAFVTRVR